jgi:hypothetical protein
MIPVSVVAPDESPNLCGCTPAKGKSTAQPPCEGRLALIRASFMIAHGGASFKER